MHCDTRRVSRVTLETARCWFTLVHMKNQPNTPARLAYPINESAALLGVSRRTVYELIRRGTLRPVRVGARQRIPAAELARLTQPHEVAA